jgi:hypothetical protein
MLIDGEREGGSELKLSPQIDDLNCHVGERSAGTVGDNPGDSPRRVLSGG